MARQFAARDTTPVLNAAALWIDRCLIHDRSLFSEKALWTLPLAEELSRAFIDHPDEGKDDFATKLKRQMEGVAPQAKMLMAEMLWALLLFPSNLKPVTKRDLVRDIWGLSGEILPQTPSIGDAELSGIGSGGTAFSTLRDRELSFLITVTVDLKRRAEAERRAIFSSYDAFVDWIEAVPQKGRRQFRHMFRFFAFPDRVERMTANRERRQVLENFGVAPQRETRKWSDRQLDNALFTLRTDLEAKHPSTILDFYEPPLREDPRSGPGSPLGEHEADRVSEGAAIYPASGTDRPVNLILYGPPGTGKTHWLRGKAREYTDTPEAVDPQTWLRTILADYGWRPVIAATLAELGAPARVSQIHDHEWIQAKGLLRRKPGSSIQPTLWGFLQEHTPENVATVQVTTRRPPFIFHKNTSSQWSLLPDWRESDSEAAQLLELLRAGHQGAREEVQRFRTVTFHPSYGYEDFVRGIRPVVTSDDGSTQFQMVDGVFKQLCDTAVADPSHRYALFIDEINRANIAKVFGELITLIEADKRVAYDAHGHLTNGMVVQLTGGITDDGIERPFGVPANLDIYGTMNTADRSIALLDVALRRRFEFLEMEPEYGLLERTVGTVHLGSLLNRINERLEYLLDRDHRIGHAYLLSVNTLEELRRTFRVQIIPLLQEYFFDDFSRIAAVLSTARSTSSFVERQRLDRDALFPTASLEYEGVDRFRHVVTPESTWTEEHFVGIYRSPTPARENGETV